MLTGASAETTGAAVPGWDFNLYARSSTSTPTLTFFWNLFPGDTSGGVALTTTGSYRDLSPGAVISSASIFSTRSNAESAAAFQTSGTHNLGFRFFNESTNAVNFGYLTMTTNGPTGFPATVNGWTFENSGGAITVPDAVAAIPEPATWAMMMLGFGFMGAAMRRTRATTLRVRYAP